MSTLLGNTIPHLSANILSCVHVKSCAKSSRKEKHQNNKNSQSNNNYEDRFLYGESRFTGTILEDVKRLLDYCQLKEEK